MGGIPWWAALIGTPIAAGKMANGVTETVESLNKVNDMLDNRADRKQYAADLSAFSTDKSYLPKSTAYRNPETAMKVIQDFQKQAAPSLMDQFKTNYETITGTSDPRFFGDAEGRGELAKSGLNVPAGNPVFNASLADFQREGAQRQTLKAALEGDKIALANVAADKELAPSFHQALQGNDLVVKRQEDAKTEAQKQAQAKNLADYQRMVSGLFGTAQSPQQVAQFAKTGGYDPNAGNDIMAAAADLGIPAEVANKDVDNYRQLMEKTPVGKPYTKDLRTGNATSQQLLQDYVIGGPKQIGAGVTNHPPQARPQQVGPPKAPQGYRYTADGNLEPIPGGPAARVKPGKALPPSAVDFFADTSMLVQNLSDAQELARKVDTGPVAGRVQGLASKFGLASDDFVALRQKFATVNNIMLKARSGAAVTENEYARFLKEMPTEDDPPNTLAVKLKNAVGYINKLVSTKRNEYSKAGYQIGDDSPMVTAQNGGTKTVVKKFVSPSTGKTKLVYSDGTEEIR